MNKAQKILRLFEEAEDALTALAQNTSDQADKHSSDTEDPEDDEKPTSSIPKNSPRYDDEGDTETPVTPKKDTAPNVLKVNNSFDTKDSEFKISEIIDMVKSISKGEDKYWDTDNLPKWLTIAVGSELDKPFDDGKVREKVLSILDKVAQGKLKSIKLKYDSKSGNFKNISGISSPSARG